LNDGVSLRTVREPGSMVLELRTRSDKPLARGWIDLTIVALVVTGMRMLANPRAPLGVRLPYARDRWSPELEAMLPSPVEYGADALAVVYSAEVLAEPLASANASIQRVAVDLAENLLAQRAGATASDDLARAALGAIRARLEHGDANLANVARELRMSERTLQRRLAASRTSLREILDQARHEIAVREIDRGSKSITDLAFLLGFSETSAFDRAFKRWTGTSPVQYKRRAQKTA
jgi:AraC-like DNA-binding protein